MFRAAPAEVGYALQVSALLWPGHPQPSLVRATGQTPAGSARDWWVVPSPDQPRLLVPVGSAAAERMLVRHGGSTLVRAGRRVVGWTVRNGALTAAPLVRVRVPRSVEPAPTAEDDCRSVEELAALVLDRAVTSGALLGPPRVNRKPVVQIFDATGLTCSFIKVGVDTLTRNLVQREAAVLTQLASARLSIVEAPQVQYAGPMRQLGVLALAPLTAAHTPAGGAAPVPVAAMAELAGSHGSYVAPLASSPFWTRLTSSAAELEPATQTRVQAVLGAIGARWGSVAVTFGSWHGDWAPWNMAWSGSRLQLWDWERFACDVPWGFDAVHYLAQPVRHLAAAADSGEATFLTEAAVLLSQLNPPGPLDPQVVLVVYLVEIALRLLSSMRLSEDGAVNQGGNHAAPRPRALWALGLAERLVGRAE